MNIDMASAVAGSDPPAAPAEWTMELLSENEGGGYVAVVKRSGEVMCRVLLAGQPRDLPVVRSALAVKARRWIADYLQRECNRTGIDEC